MRNGRDEDRFRPRTDCIRYPSHGRVASSVLRRAACCGILESFYELSRCRRVRPGGMNAENRYTKRIGVGIGRNVHARGPRAFDVGTISGMRPKLETPPA